MLGDEVWNKKNGFFTENVLDKEKCFIFARLFEKVNIGTIIIDTDSSS